MAPARKDVEASLGQLRLSSSPPRTPSSSATNKKRGGAASHAVADSWEDAMSSSGEDTEKENGDSRADDEDVPGPPPPTPISPSYNSRAQHATDMDDVSKLMPWANVDTPSSPPERGSDYDRGSSRPEKTDAVAKRLIAGALGVRAPPKTEEQKAYEKAVREKEVKRRERERDEVKRGKEAAERAKAAVWED